MLLFHLMAQAAAVVAPAQPAVPAQQGVASYPAAYFATSNTNTALDMVGRIPDFSLDTGNSVRGFEGAAGNVLINGQRPSSKTDALDAILQRIPMGKVERIDVIRGGAPGIDMQGKSVIANVVLKKDSTIRGLFALADQHVDDGRHLTGVRLEGSGGLPGGRTWEASGRYGMGSDDGVGPGHNETRFADGRPPQIARIQTYGTDMLFQFAGAFETPAFGGRLRLNGFTNLEKFKEPEQDFFTSPAPDQQAFYYAQVTRDTEAGGRYSRALGTATDLELVTLRTSRHRTTNSFSDDLNPAVTGSDASDHFFNNRESSELIVRGVLKHRFGDGLSMEAGAENADNKLDSRTSFTANGAPVPLPAANVRVEEKRTEVFVKAAWRPLPEWTVDAALRYESSDISSRGDVIVAKSLSFAKPRLTVAWTPVPATQLRLRVEKEVGQLDFNDFVASSSLSSATGVTTGNPNLNPQQAWVVEGQFEQKLWTGSSVVLAARHFKLTDVVDRGPVFAAGGAVFDQPTNIGEGTKDEIQATVTLRMDPLGWKGALVKADVTRRWSEVTDPATHEKREISRLHPIDWSVNFSQDLPAYHASVGFDLYNPWRETSYRFNFIETVKVKAYFKPYVEWKPRPDLSLRVELPLINHPKIRLRDEIKIYDGPRVAGGLPAAVQERTFTYPYSWYIRFRKQFG
jgi:outer membrane receptor protein involved in Fe transport